MQEIGVGQIVASGTLQTGSQTKCPPATNVLIITLMLGTTIKIIILIIFRCVSISSTYPGQWPVRWSVGWSVTLSDFHCVSVCGLSQSVRGPQYVMYFPKAMTNSFQIFIGGVKKPKLTRLAHLLSFDFVCLFSEKANHTAFFGGHTFFWHMQP